MSVTTTDRRQAEYEWHAWQPGDGLRCSNHGRAVSGTACGVPVLVFWKKPERGAGRGLRKVLCEAHVAGHFFPGGLSAGSGEAEKRARETVLANHWDEYQAELKRQRDAAMTEALAGLPDELRPLVEKGLAAHGGEPS